MKKLLLFACTIAFTVACSSNDDNSSNNSNNNANITPPAWIQGTWKREGVSANVGYRFTHNDFCQLSSIQDYCWKSAVENANAMSPSEQYKLTIKQEISNDRYLIVMDNSGIQNLKLEFKKKSDTEIIWTNAPGYDESFMEPFIYVKQ